MPQPSGWQRAYRLEAPHLRLRTIAVAGAGDHRERLTLEWFRPPLAQPDPLTLAANVAHRLRALCKGARDRGVFAGEENGYPTAVRLLICPQRTDHDHGMLVMLKAIRGETGFGLVLRHRRITAFDPEAEPSNASDLPVDKRVMARWGRFMRAVELCDPESGDHACPKVNASGR